MTNSTHAIETIPANSDPASERPRALAVQLGDRTLWLGNGGAADPSYLADLAFDPEAIVSLTHHQTAATTDHHPLTDAVINDCGMFAAAVETTREHYRNEVTTLVHCAAGISRSATVLATALAVEEECRFETAVDTVQQYRKRANPHAKLRINACDYLVQRHNRQSEEETLAEYTQRVTVSKTDSDAVVDRCQGIGGE